jgi:quinol-cytochrome oxidoreductase complex cytochrome b subunit
MSYINPEKQPYGKASFLTIFIIFWVMFFVLSYYGSSDAYYGGPRPFVAPFIFSTMIAFLIACFCFAAGGGTRNPKELTDGITWDHI